MSRVIRKPHQKQPDETKEQLIKELIDTFNNCGYSVRVEKGIFKGGFCLLREQKILLLNKNLDQDKKISFLVMNLSEINTENIFIKPNIRSLIEKEKELYQNNSED
jgi:hypothetical protein